MYALKSDVHLTLLATTMHKPICAMDWTYIRCRVSWDMKISISPNATSNPSKIPPSWKWLSKQAPRKTSISEYRKWGCKKSPFLSPNGETTFPHHLVYNRSAALSTCKPPALERYPPHPLAKEREVKP